MKKWKNLKRNLMEIDCFLRCCCARKQKCRAKRTLKSVISDCINRM